MIDTTTLPPMACGRCICFVENAKTNGKGGECHYNPPAVVVTRSPILTQGGSQDHINTVFTPVPIEAWCMRFADREQILSGQSEGNDKVLSS